MHRVQSLQVLGLFESVDKHKYIVHANPYHHKCRDDRQQTERPKLQNNAVEEQRHDPAHHYGNASPESVEEREACEYEHGEENDTTTDGS